jgi:hypothetical protein
MAIKRTTDHEEIRRQVEEHGGKPAIILGTTNSEGDGALIISFNEPHPNMSVISWSEFFDAFEKNNLRFHYEASPQPNEPKWEYGFDGRNEPSELDDETELPEDIDEVEQNMFPSAPDDSTINSGQEENLSDLNS